MIDKDSICILCKHMELIATDKSSDRAIALVDCAQHLYAFPLKSGATCPYFKEKKENKNGERI